MSRVWASPWTHVAAVAAVSLVVLLQYGPLEYPILGDRAYFLYLGQAILRGESIYANTFMGYLPTSLLLSAASMGVGGWLDVPTYLAPRFLGMLVAMSSVVLVYLVVRRALSSASAGVVAAIALAGSAQFAALSVCNLEPKNLVILLSLASCLALQRHCWWASGLACSLAASSWQPAAVLGLVAFGITACEGRPRVRALLGFALGALLGLLPTLSYLALVSGWGDFWDRFLAQIVTPHADSHPLRWAEVVYLYYSNELLFFLAAALGFLGFVVRSLRERGAAARKFWLGAEYGGLPLLTSAWLLFDSFNFQGLPDVLPLLPVTAFWVGWLWLRIIPLRTPRMARIALTALLATYAFADALLYRPTLTLEGERTIVDRIVAAAGSDGVVMAFGAEEIYVLAERPSPIPFLRMNQLFEPSLPLALPGGCPALLATTLTTRPAVIVTRDWSLQGDCVRQLERQLPQRGYRLRRVSVSARQWQSRYIPDDARVSSRVWKIYEIRKPRVSLARGPSR